MDAHILARLRIHDACATLTEEEVIEILEQGEVVHAKAGEIIHNVGDKLDSICLVVQGRQDVGFRIARYAE